jgi:hypothetical protein
MLTYADACRRGSRLLLCGDDGDSKIVRLRYCCAVGEEGMGERQAKERVWVLEEEATLPQLGV